MARIKIAVPENILVTIDIPVRITDINYGNHVGNDSLVGIVHESRVQWLKLHDYSELNVAGTSLIMGDLAVEYNAESFYGDILQVSIAADEITRVSFELYYSIQTKRNGQIFLIAKAKTGMVCYDYEAKKVMSVPDKLKEFLMGKNR